MWTFPFRKCHLFLQRPQTITQLRTFQREAIWQQLLKFMNVKKQDSFNKIRVAQVQWDMQLQKLENESYREQKSWKLRFPMAENYQYQILSPFFASLQKVSNFLRLLKEWHNSVSRISVCEDFWQNFQFPEELIFFDIVGEFKLNHFRENPLAAQLQRQKAKKKKLDHHVISALFCWIFFVGK